MSVDYTSRIGALRLLIGDANEEELEYSDEQIKCFLQMTNCDVLQASILALQGLVAKYSTMDGAEYRIDTIQYREPKSRAANYRSLLNDIQQSIADGTNPLLAGVPKTYGIYTADRDENLRKIYDGEIIPPRTFDDEYDMIYLKHSSNGPYYRG